MSDVADHLAITMPSHPKYLPLVRSLVDECATQAGFDDEERTRIVLAVTEAVTNVIRHAYGGDTAKQIDLLLYTPPDRFHLEIVDYGRFVSPDQIASRPLDDVRPGGLGVHLMKSTMDEVAYRKNVHGGTTLTLTKSIAAKKETS